MTVLCHKILTDVVVSFVFNVHLLLLFLMYIAVDLEYNPGSTSNIKEYEQRQVDLWTVASVS